MQHELRALRQTREALEDQLERVSRHSGNGSQAGNHSPPSKEALEDERRKVGLLLLSQLPLNALSNPVDLLYDFCLNSWILA